MNMDGKYRISAVVPTYNREKTITRCLDSILSQTYPVYEVIVVDDGSQDKTLEIISSKYADRVRIVRTKHRGAQAARNAGIIAATGEYIAFLDSDDEWVPNKIELQIGELDKNRDAIVCGDGYVQTDIKNKIPKVYQNSNWVKRGRRMMKMQGVSGFAYEHILQYSFCMFQALLVSKKNLLEIGLLDERVPSYQEWDTAIRLGKKYEFAYIKKPLFIYHLHDGETISKNEKKDVAGREYLLNKYQYEILAYLGAKKLTNMYKELARRTFYLKNIRCISFFLKYCMGKMNLFYLR
jgi:glycosyltransferase involved in cell wall biosynthesis